MATPASNTSTAHSVIATPPSVSKLTDSSSAATAARIRMSLLGAYLRDLEAHAAGDTNRFDRMVGSRGETLASRDQWIASVRRFLADPLIAEHCPADLAQAKARAVALAIIDAPGGEIDHA